MKYATIHTVQSERLADFFFTKDAVALARQCMQQGLYTRHNPIGHYEWESGEAAAEEMFDLTNNPGRQQERVIKYGRGRSVSVGDIVETEGVFYVCCSTGWEVVTM